MTSASLSLPILLLKRWWLTPKKPDTNCLTEPDLYSSEHGIGGVRGTKEALRWAFDKSKTG